MVGQNGGKFERLIKFIKNSRKNVMTSSKSQLSELNEIFGCLGEVA